MNVRISQVLSKRDMKLDLVESFLSFFLHTKRAVITGEFARGTSSIELHTTDSADFIIRHIPAPSSNSIPFLDINLHFWELEDRGADLKRDDGDVAVVLTLQVVMGYMYEHELYRLY